MMRPEVRAERDPFSLAPGPMIRAITEATLMRLRERSTCRVRHESIVTAAISPDTFHNQFLHLHETICLIAIPPSHHLALWMIYRRGAITTSYRMMVSSHQDRCCDGGPERQVALQPRSSVSRPKTSCEPEFGSEPRVSRYCNVLSRGFRR